MDSRIVGPGAAGDDDERVQTALRPRDLDEFIGQDLQRRLCFEDVQAAYLGEDRTPE